MDDTALKETLEAQTLATSGVALAFLWAIEVLIETAGIDQKEYQQRLERLAGERLATQDDVVTREAARGLVAALLGKDPKAYLRPN